MNKKNNEKKNKFIRKIKVFLIILGVITFLFIVQNRIRNDSKPDNYVLTDTIYIEKVLQQQHKTCKTCLIPTEWYSESGFMTPIIAGIVDGAWQEGVAIKQIIKFVIKYASNNDYKQKMNAEVLSLYDNKDKLPDIIIKELEKYAGELAGNQGAVKAEYVFGKLVFNATTLIFTTAELAGIKPVKFSNKIISIVEKTKLTKIKKLTKFELNCKTCYKFFKNSGSLRNKIKDLEITKKLLNNDWMVAQKNGISWEIFLKDYQAHHVIPVNLLKKSEALQFYYKNGGTFSFNSIENGIMVKKVNVGGVHAKHNNYNDFIKFEIDKIFNNIENLPLPTETKIRMFDKELNNLVIKTKSVIIDKSIKENIKINNIY